MSSRDNYRQQGAPHVKNDIPIDWEGIKKKRREVQAHTCALINVLCVGRDQGKNQEDRVRLACMEQSCIIPKARVQQKDHKPPNSNGVPKARFLCNASNSINQIISDMLTDNLQALHKSDETHECNSTEDFLSKIERLNSQIRKGEIKSDRLMVGSLDVENLYGSIDAKTAGRIVRKKGI